jgi:hypothetical protein
VSREPLALFGAVSESPDHRTPCPTCRRGKPTREEWDTTPEGGRPEPCWDTDGGNCLASKRYPTARVSRRVLAEVRSKLSKEWHPKNATVEVLCERGDEAHVRWPNGVMWWVPVAELERDDAQPNLPGTDSPATPAAEAA